MDININCEIIFSRTPTGSGAVKLATSAKGVDYAATARVFEEFRELLAQAGQKYQENKQQGE